MLWLSLILPSFFSVFITEQLEKKELSVLRFIKVAGKYMLLINLCCAIICFYVFGLSIPFSQAFEYVDFSIKYILLSLVFAIFLPILVLFLKPYISFGVELNDKIKKSKKGRHKIETGEDK